jgi:hypothetical protein
MTTSKSTLEAVVSELRLPSNFTALPTLQLWKGLSTCFSSLASRLPAKGGAAYLVCEREVCGVLTLTEQLGIKVGAAPRGPLARQGEGDDGGAVEACACGR